MKKTFPLNDNWLYINDFKAEYINSLPPIEACQSVSLPHSEPLEDVQYLNSYSGGTVTYFRELTIDKAHFGSHIVLLFEGILSYSEVYVNGVFVTSHKGETQFEADISVSLKFDEPNIIVVKADAAKRADVVSEGNMGNVYPSGGMFRGVCIQLIKGEFIKDAFVTCSGFDMLEKQVRVDVNLSNFSPDSTLCGEIRDGEGQVVGTFAPKDVLRSSSAIKGVVSDAKLWEIENPVLYTAHITLKKGEKVLDETQINFGFRTVNFTRNGFYLNGRKLKLIGLNYIGGVAHFARAVPSLLQKEDVRILKNELGLNVVRTHGIASRDFISECDRLGLMVIPSLPCESYIGDAQWRESLIEMVTQVVQRDRNSPSIIAWETRVNNSADCDELYFKTNMAAHVNDGTRQSLGARSFMASRLYEDVFGYNDYSKRSVSRLKKTSKLFVPYLITEHTGKRCPTKLYDGEQQRLLQAMSHLYVIDKVLAKDNISGAIGMSFADFNCELDKGSGDNISYYGVCDIYRNLKLAGYAYKSQFCKEPVLKLSSNLSPDEFCGKLYAFTNCDYIKVFRFDKEIAQYYPNKKMFKNLPHPPILLKDFAINAAQSEGFGKNQTRAFRYLLRRVEKAGDVLSIGKIDRLIMHFLCKSLGMSTSKLCELFDKYLQGFANEGCLVVEGYKDDVCVIKKTVGAAKGKKIEVSIKSRKIVCEKGYELVKADIRVVDSNGNILDKCFEPVLLYASGAASIAGKKSFSLVGGVGSFYIRVEKSGGGKVSVNIMSEIHEIDLEAEYAKMEKF